MMRMLSTISVVDVEIVVVELLPMTVMSDGVDVNATLLA